MHARNLRAVAEANTLMETFDLVVPDDQVVAYGALESNTPTD